jgi:hypothetical protein
VVSALKRARSSTRSGSRSGDHGDVQEHAVGHHDPVRPADEVRVEEAKRADDPLDLPGEGPTPEAHTLADAEGPRAEQEQTGEEVPQRLLGGEPHDDRGERAADRERAGVKTGDPERHHGDEDDGRQADQEADDAGRSRLHAAEQRRGQTAAERPSRPPSEDHESRDGADPDIGPHAGEERSPVAEDDENAGEQRREHDDVAAGTLGPLAVDLGSKPHLPPYLGPGLECRARAAKASEAEHGPPASHCGRPYTPPAWVRWVTQGGFRAPGRDLYCLD